MLTLPEKAQLVKFYYLCGESATDALRRYRSHNKIKKGHGPVSPATLSKMITRFEETGCLSERPRSGRPTLSQYRSNAVKEQMQALASHTSVGTSSAREAAKCLHIPKTSICRILHGILKLYPYKIQTVHQLVPHDTSKRKQFAEWALKKIADDPQWLLNILWTDEAHFTLHGHVNTHNCRIWAQDNPHVYTEQPLHSPRITVWCGISASFIVGPFFIEEQCPKIGWKSCSLNACRYLKLLREHIVPTLQRKHQLSAITFMQDGAPPHVAKEIIQFLLQTFGEERLISRKCRYFWPPRSPDLTPMDFWFWGYLKSRVYSNNVTTLSDLKEAIRREISSISPDLLFSAANHVITRLSTLLPCDGGHVEHLIR